MPITKGPFGGYAAPVGPITQPIQDQIIAEINKFKALLPNVGGASPTAPMPHPDFDQIPAASSVKLRAEIDGLIAAIDATPTS